MRYHAIACDYDGTLAHQGRIDDTTLAALERLAESGRRLLLVSGRRLVELREVCPRLDLFDRVVAEDGGVIFRPGTQEETALGVPPPEEFIAELRRRGAERIACGRVIVATWEPYDHIALDLIREMGIEYQVIFNKGAVMVLPTGVNKAVGLRAALRELGLSRHNVVAVGDAENDHAFLSICECAVAVANALPVLKEHADLVTGRDHGAGVTEVVERLLATDLADINPRRHELLLGHCEGGQEVTIPSYGVNLLLAGTSGSGKSTAATAFMEQLGEKEYQYCIVDPEGDYVDFGGAVSVGSSDRPPTVAEVIGLIERREGSCSINLTGLPLEDRPAFFENLFRAILDFRTRTGRPHWLVIDEAHHLFPAARTASQLPLPGLIQGLLLITVHPEYMARELLQQVDRILVMGENSVNSLSSFARIRKSPPPHIPGDEVGAGEALFWHTRETAAVRCRAPRPRAELRRHLRKYAEGELPPERSFWFRGPDQRLNIRAQNLRLFLQIGDGVDEETWLFHFRKGDFSRWFRERIKDHKLAEEVAALEQGNYDAREGRELIRRIIEEHYTWTA